MSLLGQRTGFRKATRKRCIRPGPQKQRGGSLGREKWETKYYKQREQYLKYQQRCFGWNLTSYSLFHLGEITRPVIYFSYMWTDSNNVYQKGLDIDEMIL